MKIYSLLKIVADTEMSLESSVELFSSHEKGLKLFDSYEKEYLDKVKKENDFTDEELEQYIEDNRESLRDEYCLSHYIDEDGNEFLIELDVHNM